MCVSKKEVEKIEQRLSEIDAESAGEAAFDHKKALALYEEKEQLEARLFELYEFLEECSEL